MGFGEAVSLFFKNYTKFQGRSRRAEYWWPQLLFMFVLEGTSGPNKFGPDPKNPTGEFVETF